MILPLFPPPADPLQPNPHLLLPRTALRLVVAKLKIRFSALILLGFSAALDPADHPPSGNTSMAFTASSVLAPTPPSQMLLLSLCPSCSYMSVFPQGSVFGHFHHSCGNHGYANNSTTCLFSVQTSLLSVWLIFLARLRLDTNTG